MKLEDFLKNLEKNKNTNSRFDFLIGNKISDVDIYTFEKENNLKIPTKIVDFTQVVNGLKTENPSFELIDFKDWIVIDQKIHFATFDKNHKVVFDISTLNSAEEWTILNYNTGYEITLSISSFWSNKIWHWIKYSKKIWGDN